MDAEYERLLDKLFAAQDRRSEIISRFIEEQRASAEPNVVDHDAPISREWDAADRAVAAAQQAIFDFNRYRRAR